MDLISNVDVKVVRDFLYVHFENGDRTIVPLTDLVIDYYKEDDELSIEIASGDTYIIKRTAKVEPEKVFDEILESLTNVFK